MRSLYAYAFVSLYRQLRVIALSAAHAVALCLASSEDAEGYTRHTLTA